MTATQERTEQELTISAAINLALDQALAADPSLLILGEDIVDSAGGGVWKTFKGLTDKYGPERVRATPIAETAIVGTAVGAALGGRRVLADIMFFDFTAVCIDQIVNHAAKLRYMSGGHTPVPITITATVGAGHFGAQHMQTLEAWYMHAPGLKVVYPATPGDAKGLMTTCLTDPDPCLFIQHGRMTFGVKAPVPVEPGYVVPLGRADVKRAGSDVSLITYGPSLHVCLAAADLLAADGVSAEVVDLRSLVPLDIDTVIKSVGRTRRAVVVHHATRFCGPGAEIAATIGERLFGRLDAPVARVATPSVPIPFAPELSVFPEAADVVAAVRTALD